ncbi:MAG: prepilin-type N-terminal cleavage/methylation domain-containing protein [Planctomycetes bacterium]|nr:prepilin-type N-terminal cleavage/methylation domain-containing protein [Planctomycetota bacterium]
MSENVGRTEKKKEDCPQNTRISFMTRKRRTKNDQASPTCPAEAASRRGKRFLRRQGYGGQVAQARERRTGGLRAAFTLIELLVVMVIAVVIMAVSLPAFLSMGRGAGMRTAVNNVRSTVALSRQWAITHREQITFVASSTGMFYNMTNRAFSKTTNDHACYYATNAEGTLVQSITDLPLDVRFDVPSVSLTFKTDGGLTDLNPPPIVLVDKRNPSVETTISINGLTGGIKVE